MTGISANTRCYTGEKSLLSKMLNEEPELTSAYDGLRQKLIGVGQNYRKKLDGIATEITDGERGDKILELSLLIDAGNPKAKTALITYNTELFSDLDFLAKEVAKTIRKKDTESAKQLAALLLVENGVISDQVWALVSCLNVLDGGYVDSAGDIYLGLISLGIDNYKKTMDELKNIESDMVDNYDSQTQQDLYLLLAIKQILKNMRK